MAEYIERNELINNRPEMRNPHQTGKEEYNAGWNDCVEAFLDAIKDQPAADVEPVKHGYIVIKPRVIGGFVNHKCPNSQCKHKWQTDERVKISEMLCSECGKVLAHNYQNYCPYCGAKMDGESND